MANTSATLRASGTANRLSTDTQYIDYIADGRHRPSRPASDVLFRERGDSTAQCYGVVVDGYLDFLRLMLRGAFQCN